MNNFKTAGFSEFSRKLWQISFVATLTSTSLLLASTPAMAHHAMGGRMPATFLEGFMSGLAHPIIGFDHFAFIVSVGFLAAIKRQGISIPVAFILAAMLGTGTHLLQLNLPGVELFVSSSILLFGILLSRKDSPNTFVIAGLAAFAGLFHGYAYGESIFGAEMTPVLAYLVGFTLIQLMISFTAFGIAKTILIKQENQQQSSVNLRSAGLVLCGVGLSFLASQVVAVIFPVPL